MKYMFVRTHQIPGLNTTAIVTLTSALIIALINIFFIIQQLKDTETGVPVVVSMTSYGNNDTRQEEPSRGSSHVSNGQETMKHSSQYSRGCGAADGNGKLRFLFS